MNQLVHRFLGPSHEYRVEPQNVDDVYVRTKAQQTRRVGSADEMRDVVNRAVKAHGDKLVMTAADVSAPQVVGESAAVSPYDAEYNTDFEDFFEPLFTARLPHSGATP